MVRVEVSSTGVGFKAEGVAGGTAGEAFFRVVTPFASKVRLSLSYKDKGVSLENPAILQSREEMF